MATQMEATGGLRPEEKKFSEQVAREKSSALSEKASVMERLDAQGKALAGKSPAPAAPAPTPAADVKMVDIPADATPEQIASAPPAVQDLAAQTGRVPSTVVEGVKMQQAGAEKIQQGAMQAQQAINAPVQAAPEPLAAPAEETPEQQAQKDLRSKIAQAEEAFQRDADDLKNARIEPRSFWSGKSTWEKVTAGIGLALASLTPQGAQNAVKIIGDEINRDLEIQKQNIANKKDALGAAEKRLMNLRGILKDDQAADLANKNYMLNAIEMDLKKKMAATQSMEAQKRLGLMAEQVGIEKEKNQIAMMAQLQKAQKNEQKGAISGYEGYISDPTEARKMREAVEARNQINGALGELEKITKTAGRSLSPSLRAQGDQKVQLIQLKLKELLGLGVLSEADDARLREIIDNPTNLFSLQSTSLVQQKGLREFTNNAVEQKAKGLGLRKIQPRGLI